METPTAVNVIDETENTIWSHGIKDGFPHGIANKSFLKDGTQKLIVEFLEKALYQAKGELSLDDSNGVLDSSTSTT